MRMIQDDGLYIVRNKLMTLDRDCALMFYQEHDGKTNDSIEKYLLSETDNLAVSIYVPPSPVVSGHNASDKTPMYEMPLIFVFRVRVLGLGRAFFVLGFWVLAFCPEILAYRCHCQMTSVSRVGCEIKYKRCFYVF